MSGKVRSLQEAVAQVADGAVVALGGNTLNRAPMAAVYELCRQQKRGLRLVKTAGALDVDMLCLAGCVASVDAGFISFESRYGLCAHYRRQAESGQIAANEHACYTVISALRAAAYGLPFMPVKGLRQSDLRAEIDRFRAVRDPFSGEELACVRAIRPDVAIVHVHRADELGNGHIEGPCYDDVLMTRAAQTVVLTTEELVPTAQLSRGAKAQIPHFLVSAVVHVPRGAAPSACYGCYPVQEDEMAAYRALKDAEQLTAYLAAPHRCRA